MDDLEKVFKDLKNIESSGGKLPFESLQSDKEKKEETKDDEDEIDEQQKEGRNKESSDKTTLHFKKQVKYKKKKKTVKENKKPGKHQLFVKLKTFFKSHVANMTYTRGTTYVIHPGIKNIIMKTL